MNKNYLFVGILLLILILLAFIFWTGNESIRELKKENKEANKKIEKLEAKNRLKDLKIKSDSLLIDRAIFKIDSLKFSDSIQKKQLVKINFKYEKIINTYNSSSDSSKDSIFSALINN